MTQHGEPLYLPEAMLCACLLYLPSQYQQVKWVSDDMFTNAVNRQIWVAIRWVLEHDPKVADGTDLTTRVRATLIEYEKPEAVHRLLRLTDTYPVMPVMAEQYAASVLDMTKARTLIENTQRAMQIAASDIDLDEKVDLLEALWMEALAQAHVEPGWRPIDGLATISDFMADTTDTHEWVIPGMLERQERFMLVAPEKAGKSVLTRQVAMLLANGRHPFNVTEAVPPMTTLMVDLENPGPIARRDFRRQAEALEGLWSSDNGRAYIWHKPSGIHLGDRNDRVLLRTVVERVEPDLVCLCPIYKAFDGLDRSWEEQAFGVQKPLDMIREEYNCALWLEHHAPWGEKGFREIRAIGSSRWARWLDYQVSLVPAGPPPYKILEWRSIRRDERKMSPTLLRRGQYGEPSWLPSWPDGDDHGFEIARQESEL